MTFTNAVNHAMTIWYGADLADSVILNGAVIPAHVRPVQPLQDADGHTDLLDVEFRVDDYPVVAYRTDTLVHAGRTWSNPLVMTQDSHTKTVRFSSNKRPVARTR